MEVTEGGVAVEVEGARDGASEGRADEVFYNPEMELNRDVTVATLRAYADREPRAETYLDAMAASGVRAARAAAEGYEATAADVDADADGRALDPAALADLAAEDWRAALAAAGELEPAIAREIIDTHGDRGRRAIEAVSEGRVKAYRDFTVVVGHRAEHVVEGGGCDCQDAAYNLDPTDPEQRCWHALAVDVAERVGRVDDHDMWYSEVREFL